MENGRVSGNAEAELRRRRDRGKAAQRAFRQRQSASVQKLKEENANFKNLAAELVRAAKSEDPLRLQAVVKRAEELCELGLQEDTPGKKTETAVQPASASESSDSALTRPQDVNRVANHPQSSGDDRQALRDKVRLRGPTGGRLSPRLDYGVWFEPSRPVKIFEPPPDIAPYVGAGKYTMAGRLAWACMEYCYDALQEVKAQHAITNSWTLPPDSAFRNIYERTVLESEALRDVSFIAAMVEVRMDFIKLGYMSGGHPGADAVKSELLKHRVFQDLNSKGLSRDQLWSPLDVERYIEEKLGSCQFARFQHALIHNASAQRRLFDPLARGMASCCLCMGNGPGWHAIYAARAVDSWMAMCRLGWQPSESCRGEDIAGVGAASLI